MRKILPTGFFPALSRGLRSRWGGFFFGLVIPLFASGCATKGDVRDLEEAITARGEQQDARLARLVEGLVAEINRDGGLVWERNLGEDSDEVGNSVLLTADGGYLVAGLRRAFPGGLDVYLLKADQQGHFLWSQRLGGGGDQIANSIRKTVDGGYVVAPPSVHVSGEMYQWKTAPQCR